MVLLHKPVGHVCSTTDANPVAWRVWNELRIELNVGQVLRLQIRIGSQLLKQRRVLHIHVEERGRMAWRGNAGHDESHVLRAARDFYDEAAQLLDSHAQGRKARDA